MTQHGNWCWKFAGGEIVLAKEGHAVALLGDGDDCADKARGIGGSLVVHGDSGGLGELQQLAALPEHPPEDQTVARGSLPYSITSGIKTTGRAGQKPAVVE